MIAKIKIEKVMESNYLYTLFFDGVSIELYKSYFKRCGRPKAGDYFTICQGRDENGKLLTDMYLNGKAIGPNLE